MTLSRQIVDAYWALDTIDPAATAAAKIALADALAVMAAATGLEPAAKPFIDHALGGTGHSTIIGHEAKVSAPMAALANGALAHALDFEDTFEPGMIHPNASLIPAVLALAQAERAGGNETLNALAIGCDFACRLSLALDGDPARRGWYHPPIIAGLGATLGAARLLDLSPQQAVDALGLFAAQFMLADELKRSPYSHLRAVREGLAARAAVEAALLVRAGVRAVEQPLEGKSGVFAILTGKPPLTEPLTIGKFHGPDVAIKRWPSCRGTHSAVVAAQALRESGITARDIAHVAATATPPNDMLFEPRANRIAPQTAIDAKFSIPFVFAAALEEGTVSLASFAPDRLTQSETLTLAAKLEMSALVQTRDFEARYDITLTDGSRHEHTVTAVAPWRTGDITLTDLKPKLADCLSYARNKPLADAVLTAVENIPRDGVDPLMALL